MLVHHYLIFEDKHRLACCKEMQVYFFTFLYFIVIIRGKSVINLTLRFVCIFIMQGIP